MAEPLAIDFDWLQANPLPIHPDDTDKNSRGHVLAVGGSRTVPGGLRLTGEAALRAGAGKLRFATIASLAVPLGVLVPEAGMIALPEDDDGEIGPAAVEIVLESMTRCDALVIGPAMSSGAATTALIEGILGQPQAGTGVVIDAGCIAATASARAQIESHGGRVVLTPNGSELARLLGEPADAVARDPARAVREAVERTGAVVVVKGPNTLVATPEGDLLAYSGGGIGLATGGSGDVLAGILAGLMARGLRPLEAAGWAVWLHGEGGRRLSETLGPIGYLARELIPLIPALMRARH